MKRPRKHNNGFKKRAGRIVEGTMTKVHGRPSVVEQGGILSREDIRSLNRCCKRRGIRSYSYANSYYTEVGGIKFF